MRVQVILILALAMVPTAAFAAKVADPCKTAVTNDLTRETQQNPEFIAERAKATQLGGDLVIKNVSLSQEFTPGAPATSFAIIIGKVFFADPREDDSTAFEHFKFVVNVQPFAQQCRVVAVQKTLR